MQIRYTWPQEKEYGLYLWPPDLDIHRVCQYIGHVWPLEKDTPPSYGHNMSTGLYMGWGCWVRWVAGWGSLEVYRFLYILVRTGPNTSKSKSKNVKCAELHMSVPSFWPTFVWISGRDWEAEFAWEGLWVRIWSVSMAPGEGYTAKNFGNRGPLLVLDGPPWLGFNPPYFPPTRSRPPDSR